MPVQLQKGRTFNPGDTVQADDLNNLVDNAIVLVGMITEQGTAVTALGTDQVIINRAGVLHRSNVSSLPSGATSVGLTATPGTVFNVTGSPITTAGTLGLSLAAQAANKFLCGPVSGGSATPAFRVLSPADLPIDTVTIAAVAIDWSLGNCFMKTLTANSVFTFSNPTDGQTIQVLLGQDGTGGHTYAFPVGAAGVYWPGGTKPVATAGPGRHDVLTFRYIGTHYYGTFDQDFLSV